jgi:outer membrane lipoprotein-sorting protein
MMKKQTRTTYKLAASLLSLITLSFITPLANRARPLSADKMKPEEVVAKHLASIGTDAARAAVKSRIIQGTTAATVRVGGAGQTSGGSVLASTGNRNLISVVFSTPDYPFERVGYDGKRVTIGELKPGIRSTLGKFFQQYEMPVKEGLLGGVLSTAWPLYDMTGRTAKLKYSGMKELEGRKVHVLEYDAKSDGGLKTRLYFDAETFRHVRTEYERRMIQQMPNQPSVTQQQGDAITRLSEDFSDFSEESGLTLPHTYKLTLSIEALNQRVLQDWIFTLTKFNFNQAIADTEFDVTTSTKKS